MTALELANTSSSKTGLGHGTHKDNRRGRKHKQHLGLRKQQIRLPTRTDRIFRRCLSLPEIEEGDDLQVPLIRNPPLVVILKRERGSRVTHRLPNPQSILLQPPQPRHRVLRLCRAHIIHPSVYRPLMRCVHRSPAAPVLAVPLSLLLVVRTSLRLADPHRHTGVVLILLHALDHGDLVDDVIDANKELGFLLDGIRENLERFSEGCFEVLVGLRHFAGLLLELVSGARVKVGMFLLKYRERHLNTKRVQEAAVAAKGGDCRLKVQSCHDDVADEAGGSRHA